jgi:hypothetical protein
MLHKTNGRIFVPEVLGTTKINIYIGEMENSLLSSTKTLNITFSIKAFPVRYPSSSW